MASPSLTDQQLLELEALGKRLRLAREAAGLSQQAFAERIGYSTRQIIAWEKAENTPPIWALIGIRRECDISPEWILMGPGDTPLSDVGPKVRDRRGRVQKEVNAMVRDAGLVLPDESVNEIIDLLLCAAPEAEGDARQAVRKMLRRISLNSGGK